MSKGEPALIDTPSREGRIHSDPESKATDLFTVNLAERMQSARVSGRIQVSEATYWRLRHAFEFETQRWSRSKATIGHRRTC